MVINAQNKEKYLEDLKNWLCELENAPLEEMGAFFRKRLPEYEARMTKFWAKTTSSSPALCQKAPSAF